MESEQNNSAYRKLLRGLFIYFLVPLVCTGGPVAWFSGPKWWTRLTNSLSRPALSTTETAANPLPNAYSAPSTEVSGGTGGSDMPAAEVTTPAAPIPASEDTPAYDLTEVLRFDITPGWIGARWPRVSAALGELQLQGYRVPLVTGTGENDLAGALTYYFNPWQQVQRITFVGTTGNVQKLVYLLTGHFGFARRLTNDPSLFVYELQSTDGQAKSVLWIRHVPIVKADLPRERFEVALSLERPKD
jgi:hypothetical protein